MDHLYKNAAVGLLSSVFIVSTAYERLRFANLPYFDPSYELQLAHVTRLRSPTIDPCYGLFNTQPY